MLRAKILLCYLILASSLASEAWCGDLTFPPWFKFGAATTAYQVEGAWNVSDKGLSVLDVSSHKSPEETEYGPNGDVACDSYHLWKRDVEMAVEMGLDFYSFSISWPRVLPTGYSNYISEDGVRYYNGLIDALLRNGVEPLVTLYFMDLPQTLSDLGGWNNPLTSDWFADYSRVVFSLFGDRVKTWVTINKPMITCDLSAPQSDEPEIAAYLCSKNVLIAHAKAWRLYDAEFKPKYGGKVSIGNLHPWFESAAPQYERITELTDEFINGRFAHPIYSKEGGWPPALHQFMEDKSRAQGFSRSRLPCFTYEEKELIRGTFDYLAIKHYTSQVVRPVKWFTKDEQDHSGFKIFNLLKSELDVTLDIRQDWSNSNSTDRAIYPKGLRNMIAWFREMYGDMEIIIESGRMMSAGLENYERTEYIHGFLKEILTIINEDKANITGLTVWSLMDTFEWANDNMLRSGLYEVDFSSPVRTRTARKSARYYARVIQRHELVNVTDLVDTKHFEYRTKFKDDYAVLVR